MKSRVDQSTEKNSSLTDKNLGQAKDVEVENQFIDSRPVVNIQRKIQNLANNSIQLSKAFGNQTNSRLPIQLLKSWDSVNHKGVYGTKRALNNYIKDLKFAYNEALGPGSNLTEQKKDKLKSYGHNLDFIYGNIQKMPDDLDRPSTVGAWSVLGAGVDKVKKWLDNLNETFKVETGRDRFQYVKEITDSIRDIFPIIELYYDLSNEPPIPTPTVPTRDDGNIILYRKMWKGEADIIMKSGVKAAMTGSDSYKKYFTTDKSHTDHFRNANSADADNEQIIEFTLPWDEYWNFVEKYGTPNQKKGALDKKESAILNQEQIVKGAGANFRTIEQVDDVLKEKQHHNIGVGQDSAADFDKLIKDKKIL